MASHSYPPIAVSAVALALVVLAPAGVVREARADDQCIACHMSSDETTLREPAEQHVQSVHRAEAIGCVGCHGGDPLDPTVGAHGVDTGFVGHPTAERIPSLCGDCHADASFIRRFNAGLPIDQLTLYSGGRHAALALGGEESAPVCSTCHGTHDVRPVADTRSPVHSRRVAQLCGDCHADPKRMGSSQLPTDQLAEFERSAHAAAVAQGSTPPPTCTGCHGSHGPMTRAETSVAQVCGTCHAEQLSRFRDSPHAKPFRKLGFTECVPCHGTHDIQPFQPLLLGLGPDGSCGKCHADDDEARRITEQMADELRRLAERVAGARHNANQAARAGLAPPALDDALERLAAAELRAKPAVHAVDPAALAEPLAELARAADGVDAAVAAAERTLAVQRTWSLVLLGLFTLLFSVLLIHSIRLTRRRRAADGPIAAPAQQPEPKPPASASPAGRGVSSAADAGRGEQP